MNRIDCLPKINAPIIKPPFQDNHRRRIKINKPIKIAEPTSKPSTNNGRKLPYFNVSPPHDPPIPEKISPRLKRQNDPGFITGYRGEAHVYESLIKNSKFCKVVWNALSENHNDPCVTTVGGETYYIKEDGLHYDLYAEDYNGGKYYIEVKSTGSLENKVHLSNCQIKLAKDLNSNENHVVAVVLNVHESPSIIYYKKMNDI